MWRCYLLLFIVHLFVNKFEPHCFLYTFKFFDFFWIWDFYAQRKTFKLLINFFGKDVYPLGTKYTYKCRSVYLHTDKHAYEHTYVYSDLLIVIIESLPIFYFWSVNMLSLEFWMFLMYLFWSSVVWCITFTI